MLKGLCLGTVFVLLSAMPAAAQDISGGYALVNWNGCCAHGFMIDYSLPILRKGGVTMDGLGDVSWVRFSGEQSDTSYTGGLRFRLMPDKRVPVFGQVLAGVVHWKMDEFNGFPPLSGNDFIIGFGGGTVIKATKMLGIKPQVDFFVLPAVDPIDTYFRFTINAIVTVKK